MPVTVEDNGGEQEVYIYILRTCTCNGSRYVSTLVYLVGGDDHGPPAGGSGSVAVASAR